MKLDDLEKVTALRNHRAKVLDLRRKAADQPITCSVGYSGHESDVASFIYVNTRTFKEAVIRPRASNCLTLGFADEPKKVRP